MTEPASPYPQAGRMYAIAELLRAGHAPGKVRDALKLADAGDAPGAIRVLISPRLATGTRVRSLNGAKPFGHVIGWDETLEMVVIRWDGTADHGPEACEPHEFEVIQ